MSAIRAATRDAGAGSLDVGVPAFRVLLGDLRRDDLQRSVSLDDEMFLDSLELTGGDRRQALLDYFANGRRIFDAVGSSFTGTSGDSTPSAATWSSPPATAAQSAIWSSTCPPSGCVPDIYGDAMRFQRRWHGVHAVESVPGPDRFLPWGCPGRGSFDFLFACSFFSHMPESASPRGWAVVPAHLAAPGRWPSASSTSR